EHRTRLCYSPRGLVLFSFFFIFFFFSSRRRHTRFSRDWSSDVCSSDLGDPCTRDGYRSSTPRFPRCSRADRRPSTSRTRWAEPAVHFMTGQTPLSAGGVTSVSLSGQCQVPPWCSVKSAMQPPVASGYLKSPVGLKTCRPTR